LGAATNRGHGGPACGYLVKHRGAEKSLELIPLTAMAGSANPEVPPKFGGNKSVDFFPLELRGEGKKVWRFKATRANTAELT
jgi:hypothetical protein